MLNSCTTHEPEVAKQLAVRRKAMSDDFIDEYDDETDDGDKIREEPVRGPAGTPDELEINLSALYRPTPSTTGDVSLLVLEAEMIAEGRDLGNPHVPIDEQTRTQARERLDHRDLKPAWEQ